MPDYIGGFHPAIRYRAFHPTRTPEEFQNVTEPVFLPTPEEIEIGCLEIQKTWTPRETELRKRGMVGAARESGPNAQTYRANDVREWEWTVPEVKKPRLDSR